MNRLSVNTAASLARAVPMMSLPAYAASSKVGKDAVRVFIESDPKTFELLKLIKAFVRFNLHIHERPESVYTVTVNGHPLSQVLYAQFIERGETRILIVMKPHRARLPNVVATSAFKARLASHVTTFKYMVAALGCRTVTSLRLIMAYSLKLDLHSTWTWWRVGFNGAGTKAVFIKDNDFDRMDAGGTDDPERFGRLWLGRVDPNMPVATWASAQEVSRSIMDIGRSDVVIDGTGTAKFTIEKRKFDIALPVTWKQLTSRLADVFAEQEGNSNNEIWFTGNNLLVLEPVWTRWSNFASFNLDLTNDASGIADLH